MVPDDEDFFNPEYERVKKVLGNLNTKMGDLRKAVGAIGNPIRRLNTLV